MPSPAADASLLRLRGPADVVAAVPYLFGFSPRDSLVLLGVHGPEGRVGMSLRVDLPPGGLGSPAAVPVWAGQMAAYLARGKQSAAVAVLYAAADARVQVLAEAVATALDAADIGLREMLRVHDRRWWSLTCTDGWCCPPGGQPVPESSSVVAATATLAGLVAHDTRADLAKTLAPVTGQARARMVEAFAQARGEPVLASSGCVGATDVAGLAPLAAAAPVDQALAQIRADPAWRPDDLSAARVCLLVGRIPVRDRVWLQISGQDLDGHRALWADLVRRAERRWQAAPACLLGFTAWQQGDGTFARIALERAQQADPRYTMAGLLLHVLDAGLAPSAWDDVGARLTAPSRRQRRAAGKTRAS